MYSVHTTQDLTRLGHAVIITCDGKIGQSRFAEFHVLVTRAPQKRISKFLEIDIPDEMVLDSVLSITREHLQVEADHAERSLFPRELCAPPVKLSGVDARLIVRLWLNGLCTEELSEVGSVSKDVELKECMDRVRRLPVVARFGRG